MRERLRHQIPSVLALTLVTLLALPIGAAASSGLPATVTMSPAAAAPGATVEITGLDFPGLEVVEVHLATSTGTVHVVDTVTADSGYFREIVTLPSGVQAGVWELQARALDGSTADFRFDAAGAGAASLVAGSAAVAAEAAGNSGADIVFMLIIAVLIAAVGGSAAYAWREVRSEHRQPGMASGDDPIWSGGASASTSASTGPMLDLTAVDDPAWRAAHGES